MQRLNVLPPDMEASISDLLAKATVEPVIEIEVDSHGQALAVKIDGHRYAAGFRGFSFECRPGKAPIVHLDLEPSRFSMKPYEEV